MAEFETSLLQAVSFFAQTFSGVVLALGADGHVLLLEGSETRVVSGLVQVGDFFAASSLGQEKGFSAFLQELERSVTPYSGYYESKIALEGNILWNGESLESGLIILKGKIVSGNANSWFEPDNELEALRSKERLLSTLLRNLPGMVYRCDNDVHWSMEFISQGCLELTGYNPESLLGNQDVPYGDLILPQYQAHVWECVQESIHEGEQFEVIYQIKTASGEVKWVWERGLQIFDQDGSAKLEGFITDITQLMETEQALQQSEERYRLMAENTSQMVYDLDLRSNEIVWEGAVEEITGCSRQEFQSVTLEGWERLIHPDDREMVVNDLEKCMAESRPFLSTYRFRMKNGDYLYVEDQGDFLTDIMGETVRMVGTIKNYSDKIKLQELMIQSEKMTTVASLSAGMAHEINNPLGIISQSSQNIERRFSLNFPKNVEVADKMGLSLQLVQQYMGERKINYMLEAIKEASSRAAKIIMNMLNFSRQSLDTKDYCDLDVIIDEVLEMAETDFRADKDYDFKKIKIDKQAQADLPKVLCSKGELEQVLFNLVRNAAQALSTGENLPDKPQITIRIWSNDAHIMIEVEDNGPGMDAKVQKKVFEPFFTTKANDVGCGLGLSIAYFIITRNHGGTVHLESEPGRGAKFIVSLPLGSVPEF